MVTPIRTAAQTEYRLRQQCAADHARRADAPVEYRLRGARPILRIGSGWRALDRTPGAPLGLDELAEVRAVMAGVDPRTGERLVRRPRRVAPAGRLPAAPLLAAIARRRPRLEAASAPARLLARTARATRRDPAHTAPVVELDRLARASGVDPAAVYGAAELAHARAHAHARVDVGIRAWDLTLDVPKSVSVLWALSDQRTAAAVEAAYLAAVTDTVEAAERWCAQGQRGQHGRGRTARRVPTAGLIATLTLHTTARPVHGRADPHLHAHIMIANLARGHDGRWGGIAAGGRELYAHVPALGELLRSRLRHHLTARLGVAWQRDPHTQRWEVAGIPPELRDLYSRRRDQARAAAGATATPAQQRAAARRTATPKHHQDDEARLRAEWTARARAAGADPAAVIAAALTHQDQDGDQPDRVELADRAAARAWSTHPARPLTRAHLTAAAADAAPHGTTTHEAEHVAEHIAEHIARPTGRGLPHRHADRLSAPPLTSTQARTGHGPAARAAAHTIARLRAAATLARTRAQTATATAHQIRLRLSTTGPLRLRWEGTSRAELEAEHQRYADRARQLRDEAARLDQRATTLRATAIRADLAIADAQHTAATPPRPARTRAAIADAQHTAATPPRPARAWPQRRPGPGLGR